MWRKYNWRCMNVRGCLRLYPSVNVTRQGMEDGGTLGFWHKQKCVRISTMSHSWMSESSTFPMVHAHFCYKILYQNSPGSILLAEAISESQMCRNIFCQNPHFCPSFSTPPHPQGSHWLVHYMCLVFVYNARSHGGLGPSQEFNTKQRHDTIF